MAYIDPFQEYRNADIQDFSFFIVRKRIYFDFVLHFNVIDAIGRWKCTIT